MMQNHPEGGAISKKLIVGGVICLIVLGGLFLAIAPSSQTDNNSKSATEVATLFFKRVAAKDSTGSYALFTDALKKDMSEATWKKQVDGDLNDYANNPSLTESNATVTSSNGTTTAEKLTYTLTPKSNTDATTTYTIVLTVVKQSNTWKIDTFKSTIE